MDDFVLDMKERFFAVTLNDFKNMPVILLKKITF